MAIDKISDLAKTLKAKKSISFSQECLIYSTYKELPEIIKELNNKGIQDYFFSHYSVTVNAEDKTIKIYSTLEKIAHEINAKEKESFEFKEKKYVTQKSVAEIIQSMQNNKVKDYSFNEESVKILLPNESIEIISQKKSL